MNRKIILITFSVIVFLAGLYFYLTFGTNSIEPFGISKNTINDKVGDCPDMLVRKGKTLLLYNSNLPAKDGNSDGSEMNPIPFYNLDEYINYLEIQKKKGKICPVLFLQYENDAQGNDVYRIRPSPFSMQGGTPNSIDPSLYVSTFDPTQVHTIDGKPIKIIDSNRANGPFNKNMYAGFDPQGLHNGEYTELDAIHDSTEYGKPISENPMDTNWGGVQITEKSVNDGNYVNRYVSKPLYFTPKTNYLPDIGPLPPSEAPEYLKPKYE